MPNEVDRPQDHPNPILTRYELQHGFLIVQLGVTTTHRFEPDQERALEAAADRQDVVLQAATRVRRKR